WQHEVVERPEVVACRIGGRRERQPAVAAQAAVPADPVCLAQHERVLVPHLADVEPDQLVAAHAAGEQLVVEPGYKANGLFAYADAGKRGGASARRADAE